MIVGCGLISGDNDERESGEGLPFWLEMGRDGNVGEIGLRS